MDIVGRERIDKSLVPLLETIGIKPMVLPKLKTGETAETVQIVLPVSAENYSKFLDAIRKVLKDDGLLEYSDTSPSLREDVHKNKLPEVGQLFSVISFTDVKA